MKGCLDDVEPPTLHKAALEGDVVEIIEFVESKRDSGISIRSWIGEVCT